MLELALAGVILIAFGVAAIYHAYRRDMRRGYWKPSDVDVQVGLLLIAAGFGTLMGVAYYWTRYAL